MGDAPAAVRARPVPAPKGSGAGALPATWPRLLGAKLRTRLRRDAGRDGRRLRGLLLGGVALVFGALLFAGVLRMVLYFRGVQGIGDLLAAKLLGLALMTFLTILLLSNVITSLSTFFLSGDLELLLASPVEPVDLYAARLAETVLDSSWMVLLLALPLVAAYGVAYGAGAAFYLQAAPVLAAFVVIPGVVGTAVTLLLVNVFPARRARDLLALVALLAAGGLVALLRVLRPERLVRPEEFQSLVDFMAVLRTPTAPWLPNEWAADALMGWLLGVPAWDSLGLLASTAAALVVLGAFLHARFHGPGYTRAQEGAERREARVRKGRLERALRVLPLRTRLLVAKEIRVFFRDSTQWSQLILLGVLVAVYVYNIRVLPLHTGEKVSFFLVNAVSFVNLGLAGFVVAAVAARFVFPAMSLEGRVTWLLRSSPLDVRTLYWTKFWVGAVPMLLLALPLIVLTNVALGVSTFVFVLTTASMVGVTLALTALALGFGALHPNYETENVAEIPTSFGGLLFMMTAVAYLAGVVVLEAWPVHGFLASRLDGGTPAGALPTVLGLVGAGLLTLLATALPLRAGLRRVSLLDN